MKNVNECVKDFIANNKGKTIHGVWDAGDSFLIEASEGNGVDYSNPFFLKNKNTLEETHFLPIHDLKLYQQSMEHEIKLGSGGE